MGGEAGAQLALEGLDRVVGVGASEVEEDRGDPIEPAVGPLHRLDGVGEAGLGGIGGDGVEVRPRLGEGGLEGGTEVLVPDGLEGRQAERSFPVLEQRVHRDLRFVVRGGNSDEGAAPSRAGVAPDFTA
jgi:hypothetical protein